MKTRMIILTIATLLLTHGAFAQTEQKIAAIQTEVAKTSRNAKVYTKKTKDIEGASAEGTTATYFLSGGEIKKITVEINGEAYSETDELYYSYGVLVFALKTEYHYDPAFQPNMPGSGAGKVSRVVQKRLYFNEGQMIRLLVGKASIRKGNEVWNNEEKRVLELADSMRQEMPLSD